MPSHLFVRTGRYRDSIAANRAAAAADEALIAKIGDKGLYRFGYYPHNVHFLLASAQMAGDRATVEAHARAVVDAIATSVIAAVPAWMGPYMAIVTGVLSIPFTFFTSNDAFYFGVVPILAKAAAVYGISAAEIGRASIIGQPVHLLSPLVASTYLLVGMSKIEFGDHQRYTLIWSISASIVMLVAALVFGVIPFVGG